MKNENLKPPSLKTNNGNGDFPYVLLSGHEQMGSDGIFGFQISVAGSILPDLDHKMIRHAAYAAMDLIQHALLARVYAEDPKKAEQAKIERLQILDCFPDKIFVEEIPNGYWTSDSTGVTAYHALHLPWFIVTTEIGRFEIGWRKRVISIEWKGIPNGPNADKLFPEVTDTKWRTGIHAYNYDDAKKYIKAVFEFVKSGQSHKEDWEE